MEVVKDGDVQLECEVSGTPPFEVTWLKNNREIRSSKKYSLTDSVSVFDLHITRCDPSDAGEYQCIVSNEGGSCSSSTRVSLKGQWYHEKQAASYKLANALSFYDGEEKLNYASSFPPTIPLNHRTTVVP